MNESGKIEDIQSFESIIEAEACNNNNREVYLQYKQCNFKYSNLPTSKKIKKKYNKTYDVDSNGFANPMAASDCEKFKIKKTINPLQKK